MRETGFTIGKHLILGFATLVLSISTSSIAFAQNLANVPGSTSLQSRTGAAVAAVCSQFIAANAANPASVVGRDNGTAQGDLFGRCGDMVHNANALLGNGPTAFSLGLTAGKLEEALNNIAHDETAAQGTNTNQDTKVQVNNLSGRLATLRGGAKSVATASLNLRDSSGQQMAANSKWLDSSLAAGEDEGNSRFGVFITGD